jgi:uncharacterized phage-associated protein
MKLTVRDVANYFILLSDGGDLTNLKAQKLVYYAYGLYLARYNKRLFEEPIEAWAYGPVVPDLYHNFKQYKEQPIPLPSSFNVNAIPEETRKFLQNVYVEYGEYKAKDLCDLSHIKHAPWDVVFNDDTKNYSINDSLLRVYFTELELLLAQKKISQKKAAEILAKDASLAETMYILSNPHNAKKLNDAINSSPDDAVEIDWKND